MREQRAGDPLDPEGEADMFDRAFVPDLGEHPDKTGCFFIREVVQQVGDGRGGITEPGRGRNRPLGGGGMGKQGNLWHGL